MANTYNEEIDISVISSVINGGEETFSLIQDLIEENYFWWNPLGNIWRAFNTLHNQQSQIDRISVLDELKRNSSFEKLSLPSVGKSGIEAYEYLCSYEANPENAETYAKKLIQSFANRKLTKLSETIDGYISVGKDPMETISAIDIETGKISTLYGSTSSSMVTAKEAVQMSIDETIDAMNGKGVYIETGLRFIDDVIGGLGEEKVIMLAGAPGSGKSALGSSIINKVTIEMEGKRKPQMMGCLTLEMSSREYINRIISNHTGISSLRLDKGKLTKDEFKEYQKWASIIAEAPIVFDDSPELSYAQLKTKIRKMVERGCKSILIDQLNLLTPPPLMGNKPEHELFNWGTYKMKAIAREFKTNIIILHQLSRAISSGNNRGKDINPISSDVQSGGDKACDCVGIIRHFEDKSFINWVKNRQGAILRKQVDFYGEKMRFEDSKDDSPTGFEEVPPSDMQSYYSEFGEEHEEIAS